MRRVVVTLFAACAALAVPAVVLAQAPAPAPAAPARIISTAAVAIHRNARAITCSFLVADERPIFGRARAPDK